MSQDIVSRKYLALFIMLWIELGCGPSNNNSGHAVTPAVESHDLGDIIVNPVESHNLGNIIVNPDDKQATLKFEYKNNTNHVQELTRVVKTCSCTDVTFVEKKLSIGQSTYICVTINSQGKSGKFLVNFEINNGKESAAFEKTNFLLECNFLVQGSTTPYQNLGEKKRNDIIEGIIKINTYSNDIAVEPPSVLSIDCDSDYVKFDLRNSKVTNQRNLLIRETPIYFHGNNNVELGKYNARLKYVIDDNQKFDNYTVVSWSIIGNFACSPTTLYFGNLDQVDRLKTCFVRIKPSDERYKITNVNSDVFESSIRTENNVQIIGFSVKESFRGNFVNETIILETNCPEEPIVKIKAVAYRGKPEFPTGEND